ncbi:MAG: Uma2 family endonuclease [Arcicella sp.]|nr:Uma2 family endonuclease [Arcicella sp.]
MVAFREPIRKKRIPIAKIPDRLVYEVMDGNPIFYKGYKEVLAGKKTYSEIMGSSKLQSLIVSYLLRILFKNFDEEQFTILSSEAGIHLDNGNNLAGDILIFTPEQIVGEEFDEKYADVPPKIAIEVDISADVEDLGEEGYIYKKTQKLLDFGVEKVIWITTKAQKVTVATPDKDWQISNWNKDIEVMDGVSFNIGEYLLKKKAK